VLPPWRPKKGPTSGLQSSDIRNTDPSGAGKNSIAEYVPKINPSAGRILKYFPDALLTPEQQTSAAIARLQEEICILEKT
jgi:hypothetical protein